MNPFYQLSRAYRWALPWIEGGATVALPALIEGSILGINRGAKFDLLSAPSDLPLIGDIPVVGDVLNNTLGKFWNLPAEGLGLSMAALMPENSEYMGQAREEGALKAWRDTDQVDPILKMGAETLAGLLTPGVGTLGGWAKPATPFLTAPVTKAWQKGTEWLPKLDTLPRVGPLLSPVSWLFKPSHAAQYHEVKDKIDAIVANLAKRGADPNALVGDINAVTSNQPVIGAPLPAAFKRTYGLSDAEYDLFRKSFDYLDPKGKLVPLDPEPLLSKVGILPGMATIPMDLIEQFYSQLGGQLSTNLLNAAGLAKNKPLINMPLLNLMKNAYNTTNQIGREVLMSGGGIPIANVMDIDFKTKLSGINSMKYESEIGQLIKDFPALAKGTIKVDDYVKTLMSDPDLAKVLGLRAFPTGGGVEISPEIRSQYLSKLSPSTSGVIGGLMGFLAGGPVGAGLGAFGGIATKYGSQGSSALMRITETMGRKTAFLDGIKRYYKGGDSFGSFKPIEENPHFIAIQGISPSVAAFIKASGDDAAAVEAHIAGLPVPPDIRGQLAQLWTNLHDNAIEAGIEFSNHIHFPYTRDTNLISLLRNITPFPVFPARNLPFYTEQAIRRPILGQTLTTSQAISDEEREEKGLPYRLEGRIPIAPLGVGKLYGNLLSPLSITSQLHEPPPSFGSPNPIDRTLDTASSFGISLNPLLANTLAALGQTNQRQDIADIAPITKFIKGIGNMLPGPLQRQAMEPEMALKAPLSMIREAFAPGSVPDVGYGEYQIRKKIAELAFSRTGQPWWLSNEYSRAMIDPASPIHNEAAHLSGLEQSLLYPARRVLPFQLGYLPDEEAIIRGRKSIVDKTQGLSPIQKQLLDPQAFGYKDISRDHQKLILDIALKQYGHLGSSLAKQLFLTQNPELAQYISWASNQQAQRKPTSTDIFMQLINS